LLSLVQIGSKPHEQEVEIFLRTRAVIHEEKGNCSTNLFLPQDREIVIGFLSSSHIPLKVDKDLRETWKISNKKLPMDPVQAAYIVAFGVDERYRGHGEGYGKEIHAAFIRSLTQSMVRPRFVFLKVWDDSPAVRLYENLGYRRLGATDAPELEDRFGVQVGRLKMVLDRFQVPPTT